MEFSPWLRSRRPSPQTVAVLNALATDPTVWRYGYELGVEIGLKAGSLYPILMRLAERGLLVATWESDPPAGRPPRHLYALSARGRELAAELSSAPAAGSRRAAGPARPEMGGAWCAC